MARPEGPNQNDSAASPDLHTVEQLVKEIRQLEVENERLREELNAERRRREVLEGQHPDNSNPGFIDWVRRHLS